MVFLSCRSNVSTSVDREDLDSTLQDLITEAIEGNFGRTPGITLSVISRGKSVNWSGAQGFDSKEKTNEVALDQPFRIASITKTFVAVSILRLHEMDSLSIQDPISKYISPEHINILMADGYDLDKITLRHCLDHTSGLYDYAVGENTKYTAIALADHNKRWTRTEQLQGAVDWGDKLAEPGDQYEYSDTGYILLGEIIEHFFDGDLALGLRTLVGYDKLGLSHTWLETLEDAPIGMKRLVHCYFGREDVTEIDPSIDLYGGGGLVSTTSDLVKFIDGLFNSEVFAKAETLDLMLSKSQMNNKGDGDINNHREYRCGIVAMPLFGQEVYTHSGLWDVYVLHDPSSNTSLATNFTNSHRYRLVKKVVQTINQLPDESLVK